MKKIVNIKQYDEVDKLIVKLLREIPEDTPLTDPKYAELNVYLKLIEDYDKIHFQVGKDRERNRNL